MKFDYVKIPTQHPQHPWFIRPLLPIHLTSDSNRAHVVALLDSGADHSLFNFEIGRELGLKLNRGRAESFTDIAGEEIIAFFHPVTWDGHGLTDTEFS